MISKHGFTPGPPPDGAGDERAEFEAYWAREFPWRDRFNDKDLHRQTWLAALRSRPASPARLSFTDYSGTEQTVYGSADAIASLNAKLALAAVAASPAPGGEG